MKNDTQEHGCHVIHTTTLGGLCEHCPLQERMQAQGHEQDKRRHAVAVMRVVMSVIMMVSLMVGMAVQVTVFHTRGEVFQYLLKKKTHQHKDAYESDFRMLV